MNHNILSSRVIRWLLMALLFCFQGYLSFGQTGPVPQDTSAREKVIINNADQYRRETKKDIEYDFLLGEVELSQDSILMFCDRATIIGKKDVFAGGNVIIQQGDSTIIYADSLAYNGTQKYAQLFGDTVVLVNKGQRLFTDRLDYDLVNKEATYQTGALLDNQKTQLRSKVGVYDVKQSLAFFQDSVYVVDSLFTLRTDSMYFNTATETAIFIAPTRIVQDSSTIYCEDGYYDIPNKKAVFKENAQFLRGDQRASGDVIFYDGVQKEIILEKNAFIEEKDKLATANRIRYEEEKELAHLEGNARYISEGQVVTSDTILYNSKEDTYTTSGKSIVRDSAKILQADFLDYDSKLGKGYAEGNVVFRDTSENITIVSQKAFYEEQNDYLLATGGRALFITTMDTDSLFMTSDTLRSESDTAQSDKRLLHAYNDVRILKSNLQAVCDSLVYNTSDSLFTLFNQPLIWSDTSQFKSDTVKIQMANEQIDRIYLNENALIINSPDEVYFNQIRGRYITAFFLDNDLDKMLIEGNAQSVYYVQDEDKKYIGPNQVECSKMQVEFKNNDIQKIRFYEDPTGALFPMRKANHQALQLEGFSWEVNRRPKSLKDLF